MTGTLHEDLCTVLIIFFFTYIPRISIIIEVFHQLDSSKNNFKFALKLTLKGSYMFRCEKHHPQGEHHFSFAKVTIVKMS